MPMFQKVRLLVAAMVVAGSPGFAAAQQAGGSILDQVLYAFDQQYGLGRGDVSIFVNYAQNYASAQLGGQSVSGGITTGQGPAQIGPGRGQAVAELPPVLPTGRLGTTVMGSSNTGSIDVALRAGQIPQDGPLPAPDLSAPYLPVPSAYGTTSVLMNGAANAVQVNGRIVTQLGAVQAGPGAISTSAMGAVNYGMTKLVVSGRAGLYLPETGAAALRGAGP